MLKCLTRALFFLIFKYNLDCPYYKDEFDTLDELINNVIESGMDPNYEITKNGVGTGEDIVELIIY